MAPATLVHMTQLTAAVALAFASLTAAASAPAIVTDVVATFGIVTDVHYANASTVGTRHYRDSLPKMATAVGHFNLVGNTGTGNNMSFVIEMGDVCRLLGMWQARTAVCPAAERSLSAVALPYSTTFYRVLNHPTWPSVQGHDDVPATIGFLREIEHALYAFNGPIFHVLGNHDVDVLTQQQVPSLSFATLGGAPLGTLVSKPAACYQQCPDPTLSDIECPLQNADYDGAGNPWGAGNFSWTDANVPSWQLEWLDTTLTN
eukprot:gene5568-5543_t